MALLKVGVRALLKVVAGFVAAIFGWPAVLIAAIVAALAVFIIRFRNWFNSQEGEFENIGSAVVQFIIQGFQKMVDWFDRTVIGWFGDRWQGIKDWFADQQGDYENIGSRIIDGIITGIKNAAGSLKDSLVNAARNAWNATKNFLGISSPSKLFEGIGMNMMEGMSRGISESAGIIQASVGVNSAMAANEARRFAEMAAAQRAEQQRAGTPATSAPINITVTSADPEAVVEALRRYTRNNGPLGQVVSLGQVAAV